MASEGEALCPATHAGTRRATTARRSKGRLHLFRNGLLLSCIAQLSFDTAAASKKLLLDASGSGDYSGACRCVDAL
jgi:hypothetical protein